MHRMRSCTDDAIQLFAALKPYTTDSSQKFHAKKIILYFQS